jgi:choice-of-anchor B domain-containing protein
MRNFVLLIVCLYGVQANAQLNLEQLAHVPNDSGVTLAGCWYHVDSAGTEYALIGHRLGLDIYDLSDPTQPDRLFRIPSVVSNWREVRTWQGFAYFGSEGAESGITIVDLRELPDTIYTKVWTGNDSLENKIQRSHTLGVADGRLYIYGSTGPNNGAIICSLDDPWNPDFLGQYQQNYLHDGFVRNDTLWGSEIYQGQFSIVDVSNPEQPVLLATQPTPGAFNHNTELNHSGQFLYAADEKFNTPVGAFDVSNLDNITLLDVYFPSQKPESMVHNVRYYGDDYLVCPSYGGQLTIVDVSNPSNMIETAWFVMGTSLVWDAMPYLPSGIIFATAKNEGLFIFQPTYQRAARIYGIVTDATTGFLLADAKVFVVGTGNADTTGVDGKYATGAPTNGTYEIRVERTGYQTLVVPGINLASGQDVNNDFALLPEPVSTVDPQLSTSKFSIRVLSDGFYAPAGHIRVFDVQGRLMTELKGLDGEQWVPVKHWPSGTYTVTNGQQSVLYWRN